MNSLDVSIQPEACQFAEVPLSFDVTNDTSLTSHKFTSSFDSQSHIEMVVAVENGVTSEIDVKSIKNEVADDFKAVDEASDFAMLNDVTKSDDVTNDVTIATAASSEQSHVNTLQDSRPSSTNDLKKLDRMLSNDSGEVETLSNDGQSSGTAGIAGDDRDEILVLEGEAREKTYGPCKVCGDHANGKYFGALVCVPCKTFFLRYANDGYSFVCKGSQDCNISVATRIHCKHCRYKKCIEAGMNRKVRPIQVEPREGRQLCIVCSDLGNGVHFGAMTCEGCKKFFRRGLSEHESYVCKYNRTCSINPQTRNSCRYCRYEKCIKSGMSREAIQMGRPSKLTSCLGSRRAEKEILEEPTESNNLEVDSSESTMEGVIDLSMPFSTRASAMVNAHVVNNFQALYHSQLDMVCKEIQRIQSSNLIFGSNQSSSGRVAPFLASNPIFPNSVYTSNMQTMPQCDSTVSSSAEVNNESEIDRWNVGKIPKRKRRPQATIVRAPEESENEVHSSQTSAVKKWHFHEPTEAPIRHKAIQAPRKNGINQNGSSTKHSSTETKMNEIKPLLVIPPPVLNVANNLGCSEVVNVAEGSVPWKHKRLENLSVDRTACSSPSVTSSEEAAIDAVEKEMGVKSEDSENTGVQSNEMKAGVL